MSRSEVQPRIYGNPIFTRLIEIETQFVPWLMDAVDQNLDKSELSRRLLDRLLLFTCLNPLF